MEVLFIRKVLNDILDTNFYLVKKVGLISLTISIFSSLSFLITYHFLYGYYFGGEINSVFSNFEVIRRFVPFHLNTMFFTYLMISLSVSLIIYLITFFKRKKVIEIVAALLGLAFFHIFMAVFFTRELTFENILYLSGIWIMPLIIVGMIMFTIRGMRYPVKSYSGAIFGLSSIIILKTIFQLNLSVEWMTIYLIIAIFTFGPLFTIFRYNKYWNFIFIFPYLFLSLIVIISFMKIDLFIERTDFIKIIPILIILLLLSVIVAYLFRRKLIEKEYTERETTPNILALILDSRTRKGALAFFIIMLLGTYVLIPRVSMATAKVIRTFTPGSEIQYDQIQVRGFDTDLESFKGIIVAEQDDVIYISNDKWELEQVKTDKYHVRKFKE